MREIKFRAYDKITNTMVYNLQNMYDGMYGPYTDSNGKEVDIYAIANADWINSFGEILTSGAPIMQFTGLQDKNNKDIYEGDILKVSEYPTDNRLVEWDAVGFEPFLEHNDADGLSGREVEVIGNIYENPELLEEK